MQKNKKVHLNNPQNSSRELQLINFCKVAKYKIYLSKSVVILQWKDKQAENEIREMAFLTTATNNIKYLVVTLTK